MIVYIDTSVIGGCLDHEFEEWSNVLFEEFKAGSKLILLSGLTLEELSFAPLPVQEKLHEVPQQNKIAIEITDEAISLAETYIKEGALTRKSYNDALHIAIATLSNAEVLCSWNFKHIVNLDRIRLYNSINLRLGFKIIEIRTPREILTNNENR